MLTGVSIDSHYASVDEAGNVAFGIGDALGSITGTTTGPGSLVGKFEYEPYGQMTGTVNGEYPFAFTGRVPILGNVDYYRNRYYDAGGSRFLSEDAISLSSGINLFSYALNNPFSYVDPSGNVVESVRKTAQICLLVLCLSHVDDKTGEYDPYGLGDLPQPVQLQPYCKGTSYPTR